MVETVSSPLSEPDRIRTCNLRIKSPLRFHCVTGPQSTPGETRTLNLLDRNQVL